MAMEWSQEELDYAQKLVNRYDSFSRHWVWMRWVVLILSILLLGLAGYTFTMIDYVRELDPKFHDAVQSLTSAANAGKYTDFRVEMLRIELNLARSVLIEGISGIAIFALTVGEWNRNRYLKIQARLVQSITTDYS